MATIKIKSTEKVAQAKDGTMCFVSREMVHFNENIKEDKYTSILEEKLFIQEEIDEVVFNETTMQEEPTGKKILVDVVVENRGQKAHTVTYAQSDALFKAINDTLLPTESFTTEYNKVKLVGLIIDSNTRGFFKKADGTPATFVKY